MVKFKAMLLGSFFLSISAFASDWQMTYYHVKEGNFLIDKESIVESLNTEKTFWTLFTPRLEMGKNGEGYAYNKTRYQINCADHTAALKEIIYYDENQKSHPSTIESDQTKIHSIVPDTKEDFMWQYVCKPENQKKLGDKAGNIDELLANQAKSTRLHLMEKQQLQR